MSTIVSWPAVIALGLATAGCGGGGEAASPSGAAGGGGSAGSGGSLDGSDDGSDDVAGGSGGSENPDGAVADTGMDGDGTLDVDSAEANPCGCGANERCQNGVCVPIAACQTNSDCSYDQACVLGSCAPWAGVAPSFDSSCVHVGPKGVFVPRPKCEFSVAPDGDPFPGYVDVQGTPIVAAFDGHTEGPASIAATFTATVPGSFTENHGVIRVISGADCSLQANLGGGEVTNDEIVSSATLAAADLDGDLAPEIVALTADGGTVAFTQKAGVWSVLWKLPLQAGLSSCCSWSGPSIHDLNNDGQPEILRDGMVVSSAGTVLSMPPVEYASYGAGIFPVLANVDSDPAIELSNGQYLWEWNGGAWAIEPGFPGASGSAPGHVAFADFGPYGAGPSDDPEVVVVRSGYVVTHGLNGVMAHPPVMVPGGGGGPPTVADLDGDGLPELGVSGANHYTVFDIDCGANPRAGGQCAAGTCDYIGGPCIAGSMIAWSRRTQDLSSTLTASSTFDFEADGRSEVIYADECFTRIYDGSTGDVLLSHYRSSCTWSENAVVADVDGDYRAELVIPSNKACSADGAGIACQMLDANEVDYLFPGVRCANNLDCPSSVCDQGYCRCTATAECCGTADDAACLEMGLKCAAPPVGLPGTGNTCRASHPHGVSGLRVLSDMNDQWARARRIWNQHAYAVTNINDDGTVPKSDQWEKNWQSPRLNNFRENVPGATNTQAIGDATAGVASGAACQNGEARLQVDVCNRGSGPMGAGIAVGFYVGGAPVCATFTNTPLLPGECELIGCVWTTPPSSAAQAVDVDVIANDGQDATECQEANNIGLVHEVYCP